jgi:predicted nucleotidyltransferase
MSVTPQEAAATLRRRSSEARRTGEIRAAKLREQTIALVQPQLPQGGRAWLIGSLAWGGFGERSDIDLVLAGVDGAQATTIEAALGRAVGVEVDLLMLEALPPSFRGRVEREGLAIHGC